MFTASFWKQAIERAVKTAAQVSVVFLGGSQVALDLWTIDPAKLAGIAAGGFVLSILTSVGSEPFGPTEDPSIVDP